MRASLGIASVLVCFALASAACGDDGGGEGGSGSGEATSASTGGPSSGTEATSTGTDATASSSSGAGGEACEPPATEGPECDFPEAVVTDPQVREFESFTGTVVTTEGEPVANDAIQVCGINICLYGNTDADGNVLNENGGGAIAQGATPLDVPIFKVGDGLERAKIGYAFPEDGAEVNIDATTIDLVDSETTLEGGVTAEADGVTLTIAEGAGVGLNILEFGTCGEDTFRAAVVPEDSIETMAPEQDFVALVGLGPHETLFCPPAGLSIPNDAGLAPGAEVEFVQQSLETGQYFGDYGQWYVVAVGHVSDDGETISTDDGEGIPIISTVGVRGL
jgi:hypothetical protein